MLHFVLAGKFSILNLKTCGSVDCPKLIFSWSEKFEKQLLLLRMGRHTEFILLSILQKQTVTGEKTRG